MLRFPYRRAWVEPVPVAVPKLGLLERLFNFLTARPARTQASVPTTAPSAVENLPRPFVSIRIRGPLASRRFKSALFDTGSADTLFPMELAERLGIILGGEKRTIRWRGNTYPVEFHVVELELAQSGTVWRWRARVGFTWAPLAYVLLGQRGSLEYFNVKFYGADQVTELETNRAFPSC